MNILPDSLLQPVLPESFDEFMNRMFHEIDFFVQRQLFRLQEAFRTSSIELPGRFDTNSIRFEMKCIPELVSVIKNKIFTIYAINHFLQSYGIAVSERSGLVYISNQSAPYIAALISRQMSIYEQIFHSPERQELDFLNYVKEYRNPAQAMFDVQEAIQKQNYTVKVNNNQIVRIKVFADIILPYGGLGDDPFWLRTRAFDYFFKTKLGFTNYEYFHAHYSRFAFYLDFEKK